MVQLHLWSVPREFRAISLSSLNSLGGNEKPESSYKTMVIFTTEWNLVFFILRCLATSVQSGVSGHLVNCLKFPWGSEWPKCSYKTLGILSMERNLLFFILNCPAISVECVHLVKCLRFPWGKKWAPRRHRTSHNRTPPHQTIVFIVFLVLLSFCFLLFGRPVSSFGRAPDCCAGGRRFKPRPDHTSGS